ncbi:hypothetical protein LTR53_016900 [Teratosphaeriaceae sp. CCFEE 6253]|nr:hypothetical protein LTR53_016900 [Teratosphaeriaceae sp. CCFEE 6253]
MASLDQDTHPIVLDTFADGQWDEQGREPQSLPRADGGKDAWLFLTACFLVEALIWGFPFSFGIFQAYYSTHEPFASEARDIAIIGTTSTGLMYFGLPFIGIVSQRWPRIRRPGMLVGLLFMIASLLGASCCNSVTGLIGTEGVLYAVGGLAVYSPVLQYVDEWFVARKGLAYGIMWAGTGMAGVVVPFVLQWLLDTYGFRIALRVWAVVLGLLTTPALFFVKGRLPIPASNAFRPSDFSYLRRAPFWIFALSIAAQGVGIFLPTLWLPSFAASLHFPAYAGPLSLALYNLAACVGSVALGAVADRLHVSTAMLVSILGQLVAVFVLWGCATSQPMLYTFAIVFGVFGGGYSSTWSGCIPVMRRRQDGENRPFDTGTALALLAAGKGIGAVISGPVSTRLLQMGAHWHARLAYGTDYGVLIVFTGASITLGGTAWVAKLMRLV